MLFTYLVSLLLAALAAASSLARNPLHFLARIEEPRILSPSNRVTALSTFDLEFHLYNGQRRLRLSLEPNHDIIPQGATVTYLDSEGNVKSSEAIDRLDHRVFKGDARLREEDGSWTRVGWARITIIEDGRRPRFEGVFGINHDNHHIQLRSSYMRTKHSLDPAIKTDGDDYMIIWRDSDISPVETQTQYRRSAEDELSCLSDGLDFNLNLEHPVYTGMLKRDEARLGMMSLGSLLGRRQIDSQSGTGNSAGVNLVSTIGQTAGCPSPKKVALVGVATDCTYTGQFNSTESARMNIINQMNAASSVWESTFNISLGLQNMTISDSNCPGSPQAATPWNQNCDANLDISARLNLFSAWRGTLGDQNSHWTLLTNCKTGSAVGLAWLGQACVHQAQTMNVTGGGTETVSGANIVALTSTEWQVIAHETGHTYGAVHDCYSVTCANSATVSSQQCCPLSGSTCDAGQQYIMNPSTAAGISHFSPCSIGNICSAIGRNSVNTTCLSVNKDVVLLSTQVCGNGIVEAGEDCDCGGVAGCGNNRCCDATTCKFKNNAVCDDSNEDCCTGCQFSSNSTVCRASNGICDPAETCTGTSATCPPDKTATDGTVCSIANVSSAVAAHLRCASGQCTSRDYQCQTVMSAYTSKANDTYACDSNTCTMSCASPAFGYGTCYGLQQNLLDGTPCGGGGACVNGVCRGSTFGKEVKSWIDDHKGLVIGIASALGALLLFSLLSCCITRCRRRRRRAPKTVAAAGAPVMQPRHNHNVWTGPPPPVPPHGLQMQQQRQPWEYGNGNGVWQPPMPQGTLYGNGIIGNAQGEGGEQWQAYDAEAWARAAAAGPKPPSYAHVVASPAHRYA